jgi:cytochrome c-type biogenesis protein CcmE
MDPERKRKIRLVVALSAAVLLAVALVYTSFSSSTEAREPSDLLASRPDGSFDLTGVVVFAPEHGPVDRFVVADRDDRSARIPVKYSGEVPDPFREGREIVVTGRLDGDTMIADKDSLITKCPSKFSDEAEEDPEHVIIE